MAIQWDKAFEGIVNISADAIISIDEDQKIIQFNKGAEEIFGWSAEEIMGQSIDLLIPERFRPAHPQHVRNFAAAPIAARRMGERREISGLRKNGEEFPAEASISKIVAGNDRVFTVVLRDVSERKQREQALMRAVAARDDVLSFVSHDLGNPLAAIRIATAVLLKQDPDSTHVLGIRESVEQAQRLIRDLLDVQKLEAGKLQLDLGYLDIDNVIDETVHALQHMIDEKNVRIAREVRDDVPHVHADHDRIAQLFTNLMSNAVKFSPQNGNVYISAQVIDDEVVSCVRDEGPGIPPDDLPYIFDRYWQAKSRKVGHGIGLSIVQAIAKAHGGRVWAESTPGKGSTFYFALPVAQRTS
jgi:PAS domain S-box-containing protein